MRQMCPGSHLSDTRSFQDKMAHPRHSWPAARERAGWAHVILPIRAKKPSPRAAPTLMLGLHYTQAAPCDGAWWATGLPIHQVTAYTQEKLFLTCSWERCLCSKWEERVKAWLVRPHTFNDL